MARWAFKSTDDFFDLKFSTIFAKHLRGDFNFKSIDKIQRKKLHLFEKLFKK
tara:strand:+ start:120 stop:275 length:156 start_codon:yes stop_codon:yes gene_type:complete